MKFDRGRILTLAGGLLALGTLLGAFGTHVLQGELPPDRMSFYTTAVSYQFIHALGFLGIGLAARSMDCAVLRWSAGLVLSGIVLFSGACMAWPSRRPALSAR